MTNKNTAERLVIVNTVFFTFILIYQYITRLMMYSRKNYNIRNYNRRVFRKKKY